jgi:antirestriction protein ArdC
VADGELKAVERGEARDRRVREAVELLEAGVERILDGEEFKRYLAFAARFHNYSANNTLLILVQRPSSTRIAGYRTWQSLGRQVRRGEEGMKILAPVFRTVEDEESSEKARILCYFKVVKVFDVSQTDPMPGADPLPERPRPKALRGDSDAARALGRSLLALCKAEGVRVSEDDRELDAHSPGAKGVYLPREKRIILRSTLSADGRAKTLAHELAHHLLHREAAATEADRPTFEVEAEGAAYAVLSYFGIHASGYSFAYIARWAKGKDVFKAALFNIQKTVRAIIGAVEDGGSQESESSKREAAA